MIIPILIYFILFVIFFYISEKGDKLSKGEAILCSLFPSFIFGSIINIGLCGIIFGYQENIGIKSPTFEMSKKICNTWFFNFINYIKEGGENMLQLYFQHPIAFIILIIVIVWGIKTILKTMFHK